MSELVTLPWIERSIRFLPNPPTVVEEAHLLIPANPLCAIIFY